MKKKYLTIATTFHDRKKINKLVIEENLNKGHLQKKKNLNLTSYLVVEN
jgi:hypothetical protein